MVGFTITVIGLSSFMEKIYFMDKGSRLRYYQNFSQLKLCYQPNSKVRGRMEIIMKINHIALYANDLEREKNFYIKYFGAVSNEKYHNKTTGLQTYFLSFEGGACLEIMFKPNVDWFNGGLNQAGYTHLAFSVGKREIVDDLTKRLAADGYEIISGPRLTGDGYYESCVLDPERNQIEIVE